MVFTFYSIIIIIIIKTDLHTQRKSVCVNIRNLYLQQINTMLLFFCWFLFFGGGGGNCEIQDPFDGIHIKNNIFEDDNFFLTAPFYSFEVVLDPKKQRNSNLI